MEMNVGEISISVDMGGPKMMSVTCLVAEITLNSVEVDSEI